MMDFITVPTVVGMIILGIYKVFELFVCKKERLAIIEKMGDKLPMDTLKIKVGFTHNTALSFSALKIGCLLIGLGGGIFLAVFLDYCFGLNAREQTTLMGGLVLFGGGLGLLVAFCKELKLRKKENN